MDQDFTKWIKIRFLFLVIFFIFLTFQLVLAHISESGATSIHLKWIEIVPLGNGFNDFLHFRGASLSSFSWIFMIFLTFPLGLAWVLKRGPRPSKYQLFNWFYKQSRSIGNGSRFDQDLPKMVQGSNLRNLDPFEH